MPNVVRDPVCGMEINLENAEERSEYEGEVFYFCSDQCRNRFDEEPGKFVNRTQDGGDEPQSAT